MCIRDSILAEIRAMREEARDFRLISTALGQGSRPVRSREDEETKLYQGAVETIHQSLFYTLEPVSYTHLTLPTSDLV